MMDLTRVVRVLMRQSVDYFSRAIDRVVPWDEDNGEA